MRQSLAEWISQRAGMQRHGDADLSLSGASNSELDRYQERVKQLLNIANQQATELASERDKRHRAEESLARARSELKESEKDRRGLKRTIIRASREFNSFRRGEELPAVIELRQQLDQIQHHYVDALAQEQTQRLRVEVDLKTTAQELDNLRRSQSKEKPSRRSLISERVAEERDRRRKAQKEAKKLKQKLRHSSRSLNALRRDHSKCRSQTYDASTNGHASSNELVGYLLPKLTLARDSVARLFSTRDTKQVFDDLVRLNDSPNVMRGERVGSAEPWSEVRPTLTDRIYYRQEKGRRKYLVLVGDKKTQAKDIEWMRRN